MDDDREDSIYECTGVDEADGEFMNENNHEDAEQPTNKHSADVEPDPFRCSPCDPGREPASLRSPMRPCQEDAERHYLTHLPYRNWCPVCVRAKAKEDAHRRAADSPEDKSGLPTVSLDYALINDETDKEMKLLVGKCETTGNYIGHQVLCKGLADEWIIKKIVKDLEELGKAGVILKTDGEPAIVAMQNRVQALRMAKTVPRQPPAYNPQSNGPCEKAVQDVVAHFRACKLSLESRLKTEIDDNLPVVQWLLEHAVFLLNKFSVGADGMTPYERLTGRKWRRAVLEVGEVVLAKLAIQRDHRGKAKGHKNKPK